MAVVSLDEILKSLANYEPETVDDDYLALLENISDSMAGNESWQQEVEKLRADLAAMEQKVTDTENEWRNRYKERFYGKGEESLGEQEAIDLQEPEIDEVKEVDEVAEDWS